MSALDLCQSATEKKPKIRANSYSRTIADYGFCEKSARYLPLAALRDAQQTDGEVPRISPSI
jgi:hypothetical protein